MSKRGDWLEQVEPAALAACMEGEETRELSIAISLKRIADALELPRRIETQEEMDAAQGIRRHEAGRP